MIDVRSVTSLNGRLVSAESPAFSAAHGASEQSWEQLARDLDRANRPSGRATAAVRDTVRRIVRDMMANGATHDEIRGALARAVRKYQRLLGRPAGELDVTVRESLLADVLHCAAVGVDSSRDRAAPANVSGESARR